MTCLAPFVIDPPYEDPFVAEAAALPPTSLGELGTRGMAGPFRTLEEAPGRCVVAERSASAAAPFDEVVACATGDRDRPVGPDNQPVHHLAVHTARGWWLQEVARSTWPHGDEGPDDGRLGPTVARVASLVVGDLVGDGATEVAVVSEQGPPGGDVLRRAFVCGIAGDAPRCADFVVASGGPTHGVGASLARLELRCDGGVSLVGWRGGERFGLVHAVGVLDFRPRGRSPALGAASGSRDPG